MSGLYVASKVRHADRWLRLRAEGVPVCSTWIDESGPGESASMADLWRRCIREAMYADLLLVYAESGEVSKGALVEVGAALASGVPVYGAGLDPAVHGSWVNHGSVYLFPDIDTALTAVRQFFSERG